MIPDPPVIRAGDGAQFGTAIFGLQRLHEFGAVREQAMLHVDAGKRSGKLAQITRGRADQACELAERPVGRCHLHRP